MRGCCGSERTQHHADSNNPYGIEPVITDKELCSGNECSLSFRSIGIRTGDDRRNRRQNKHDDSAECRGNSQSKRGPVTVGVEGDRAECKEASRKEKAGTCEGQPFGDSPKPKTAGLVADLYEEFIGPCWE